MIENLSKLVTKALRKGCGGAETSVHVVLFSLKIDHKQYNCL